MRLRVLVVNYETDDLLVDCVTAVRAAGLVVDVWDNASSPAVWDVLERELSGVAGVQLHRSAVNLGFGAAVNALVRAVDPADDDLLWVLNPDTVPDPEAPALLQEALAGGGWDVVSPLITRSSRPGVDERVWFAGGAVDARRGDVVHWDLDAALPAPGPAFATAFTTGAAPMVSAATWRASGGFRDDLFLYWEDGAWSLRLAELGLRQGVVPAARVWHAVGASTSRTGKSATYYYYNLRNRVLVFGGPSRMSRTGFVLRTLPLSARWAVRALRQPSGRLTKLRAVLAGTLDGVRGRTGPRALHQGAVPAREQQGAPE